jgi:hypothetical protein
MLIILSKKRLMSYGNILMTGNSVVDPESLNQNPAFKVNVDADLDTEMDPVPNPDPRF